MSQFQFADTLHAVLNPVNFDITTLEDEIRADQLCSDLLRAFARNLAEEEALEPARAGALAHGADYYLREFIIADRRENIYAPKPGRVRQFAGNWYIVKTLEPNLVELSGILEGVVAFYHFCLKNNRISSQTLESIQAECAELAYYAQRIEDFWNITGDGYSAWRDACSLKESNNA